MEEIITALIPTIQSMLDKGGFELKEAIYEPGYYRDVKALNKSGWNVSGKYRITATHKTRKQADYKKTILELNKAYKDAGIEQDAEILELLAPQVFTKNHVSINISEESIDKLIIKLKEEIR